MSDDVNRALAHVRLNLPPDVTRHQAAIQQAHLALRDGLDAYEHYNRVLRLAKSCSDPELDQNVLVTLHDCRDQGMLQAVDPKQPALPELPRNASRIHEVAANPPYCIRLTNVYWRTLYLTVFNCTAYGMIELLGDVSIKPGDVETLWLRGIQRTPFKAIPDNPSVETIDRIIAIATTRQGGDLRGFKTTETIQDVIDKNERGSDTVERAFDAELWTAVTVPLKIGRQGG